MDLTDIKTIKSILQKHNLFAKKHFGQNFLISQTTLNKIIETAEIKPTPDIAHKDTAKLLQN